MCRVFVSYSQPIRFARFDGKSVNPGLPVLDKARALDPWRRSEGSWLWGRECPSLQHGFQSGGRSNCSGAEVFAVTIRLKGKFTSKNIAI